MNDIEDSEYFFSGEETENFDLDIQVPPTIPANADSLDTIFAKNYETVKDLLEFEIQISYKRMSHNQILYRGHSNKEFELKPSLIRNDHKYNKDKEMIILNRFKEYANKKEWDKFRLKNFNENLFYLSIARHLGVRNRLLDWTGSFWTALSFLSDDEDHNNKDGALWVLMLNNRKLDNETVDPMNLTTQRIHVIKESFYNPDGQAFPMGISQRYKQNGHFTIVPDELMDSPLDAIVTKENGPISLHKIVIPQKLKEEFRQSKNFVSKEYRGLTKLDSETQKFINELNRM